MKNLINCTSSDFDYFSEQNTQNILRDGQMAYFAADLKSEGQATITIAASPQFLDLSKAQLYVKIKVYKGDKTSEKTPTLDLKSDTVSLCNNTLHSLWSQINLELNDNLVENKMMYGLQSYIQDLLNFNLEAKNSSLQSQGWYNDTPGEMNNVVFLPDADKEKFAKQTFNQGLIERRIILDRGEVEFMGAPHMDLFSNGKFLLNNTKMQMVLTQQNDKYVLMGSGDYTIKLLKVGLWVKKLTANDQIQNAINLNLERNFANYDYSMVKTITRKIDSIGKSDLVEICSGEVPKYIVLGLASYEQTVIGVLDKSPFEFGSHDLISLSLMENGSSYPYSVPLKFDYSNNEYLLGFKTLEANSKHYFGNGISRKAYPLGYALYIFDMTPNGECGEIKDVSRSGTISVNLEFETEAAKKLALVCYLEYDKCIQLDKTRNLVTDKTIKK